MGRPGLRPLTGRAPAPADSEGFSEPNPTTDRAVNAIGRSPDGRLVEHRNDRSACRSARHQGDAQGNLRRYCGCRTGQGWRHNDTARTPPGLAGTHFVSEDLLIIETPSDKRPSAVPDLLGVDQVVPDDK